MSDQRPDPSEVESLTTDEARYQRDENGDLIPRERVVETSEGWRKVKLYPTPKGEALRLEERFGNRDELEMEEIDELLSEKLAEPEIENWDDVKPGIYMPLMNAVMEDMTGQIPDNEFHEEVQEELEKRQGDEGN